MLSCSEFTIPRSQQQKHLIDLKQLFDHDRSGQRQEIAVPSSSNLLIAIVNAGMVESSNVEIETDVLSTDDSNKRHALPSVEASSSSVAATGGGEKRRADEDDATTTAAQAQTSSSETTARASSISRIHLCQPGVVAPVPLQSSAAILSTHPRRRKKQYDIRSAATVPPLATFAAYFPFSPRSLIIVWMGCLSRFLIFSRTGTLCRRSGNGKLPKGRPRGIFIRTRAAARIGSGTCSPL